MPHGRRAPLAGLLVGSLGITDALGQNLGVLVLQCVSMGSLPLGGVGVDVRQHPWKPPRGGA